MSEIGTGLKIFKLNKKMDEMTAKTQPNNSSAAHFFLGEPHVFVILEFARRVIKRINSSAQIAFWPLPSDDASQRKPDIRLAKNCIERGSAFQIEVRLLRTIDYFRGERS